MVDFLFFSVVGRPEIILQKTSNVGPVGFVMVHLDPLPLERQARCRCCVVWLIDIIV